MRTPLVLRTALYSALLFNSFAFADGTAPSIKDARQSSQIGLYDMAQFRLSDGHCQDCTTIPQALWYFQDDLVATPTQHPVGFNPALLSQEDVKTWASQPSQNPQALPPLLWIGSPQLATGSISTDGKFLMLPDQTQIPFSVVAKIPSNLSYYDASSIQWFANRPMHMRGKLSEQGFVARTLWPDDFALNFTALPYTPLPANESVESLVRADGKNPSAPVSARILWQRDQNAERNWANKAVMAIMLNGAQGDDDEAHGGHFALATGRFGAQGEWGNWLVNNFYNLGSVSEKGIIASMLPMDAYMADLNSGQSWYRPSYMLVAVLKDSRAPDMTQQALGRIYNHFYRQDFVYHHATANCTGISMDTLRTLGWQIPLQGATNSAKAVIALPFMTIKDMSLASGEQAFDYLIAEQTNLYPFVGFNAIGSDLLDRVSQGKNIGAGLDQMLAEDLEALIYVRIPQFPSSREYGQAPIASLDEYMKRAPENRADWKIIPVGPRNFPSELKDPNAPSAPPRPSEVAVYSYAGVLGLATLGLFRRRLRRKPLQTA